MQTGPNGLQPANYLTDSLKELGIEMYRFKTGTPARIDKRSIDFSKMEEQKGDERIVPFSFTTDPEDIQIDQVVIGSCTNGRLEDMEAAYNVLKGKHIAKGVRGIIIPATMAVYKECILRGWTTAFIDAGCIVSTPTCGPCLGGYMGILAEGERCVSTTNRNFVGRMGHVKSEVYLASPATAAASALTGYITDPRTV